MKLSTLNHILHKLTDSELCYRSGKPYDWSNMKTTVVNGREVRLLLDEDSILSLSDSPSAWTSPLGPGPAVSSLSIKRNSRFNPVPEHIHAHLELNYVYSGTCPQTINGRHITLKKNQVLLIDTECPHSIESLGENDIMISILIKKCFLRDSIFSQLSKDSILSRFFVNAINEKTSHDHYLLFHSENDRRIPLFFHEFFCECFDLSINSSDILQHLFYLIMAELINVYEKDMIKEDSSTISPYIVPLIRYIESNFLTCTQKSVAEFFHVSPNYVTTLLKKYTGLTYIQLIQSQKLKYAAGLLKNTNLSITEIAHEAGYENLNFFYKKFSERYSCSPKDFRIR